MYKKNIKRLIDLLISLLLLVLLLPFLLIICFLVGLTSKGPFFFIQRRLGKKGESFEMLKFRTMIDKKRNNNDEIYLDNPEITNIGKGLRRFKIDELPQLINVLRGDMSLVGPRPCLPTLRKKFDENGEKRLKVKPGLTGLAQINGNIHLSWEERWYYDAKYVENISFFFDMKIVFKTFLILIFGEDKFVKRKDGT